jgi:hypothetical protein
MKDLFPIKVPPYSLEVDFSVKFLPFLIKITPHQLLKAVLMAIMLIGVEMLGHNNCFFSS